MAKIDPKDPFELTRQQVCDETFYFNHVFSSSNYYVYSLCTDKELTDCEDTLAKVYPLNRMKRMSSINMEAEFMERASQLGVSPKFLGLRYCMYKNKPYAVLLMSKYGEGNLTMLMKNGMYETHKHEIHTQLKHILDTLYDHHIDHNDLHSDNILYKINEQGQIELKIIDFDAAIPLKHRRTYTIEDRNGGPDVEISGKLRRTRTSKVKRSKRSKCTNKHKNKNKEA